jgi:hypothetical protein
MRTTFYESGAITMQTRPRASKLDRRAMAYSAHADAKRAYLTDPVMHAKVKLAIELLNDLPAQFVGIDDSTLFDVLALGVYLGGSTIAELGIAAPSCPASKAFVTIDGAGREKQDKVAHPDLVLRCDLPGGHSDPTHHDPATGARWFG